VGQEMIQSAYLLKRRVTWYLIIPFTLTFFHDFNLMCRVLVAGLFKIIYAGDVEKLKYMLPIII
jgi:hypothetical protein